MAAPGITTVPAQGSDGATYAQLAGTTADGKVALGHTSFDQTGNFIAVALDATVASVATLLTGASGTDESVGAPSIGNVLATGVVTRPGGYFIQNQSGVQLQVWMDDGLGGTPSVFLLDFNGLGTGFPGAVAPVLPWFTGRIRIIGDAASPVMFRVI